MIKWIYYCIKIGCTLGYNLPTTNGHVHWAEQHIPKSNGAKLVGRVRARCYKQACFCVLLCLTFAKILIINYKMLRRYFESLQKIREGQYLFLSWCWFILRSSWGFYRKIIPQSLIQSSFGKIHWSLWIQYWLLCHYWFFSVSIIPFLLKCNSHSTNCRWISKH